MIPHLSQAASPAEWAKGVNRLAAKATRAHVRESGEPGRTLDPSAVGALLWTDAERPSGTSTGTGIATGGHRSHEPLGAAVGFRMAHDVAEQLVQAGLDPDYLGEFAAISGLDARDVLDFTGIDRSTVSRRKASGAALPQDAAVKALQATDLMTQATEVFGAPDPAARWLTKGHPVLDGETPLRRARTPWGMAKVQSMLVALRYGGAA